MCLVMLAGTIEKQITVISNKVELNWTGLSPLRHVK